MLVADSTMNEGRTLWSFISVNVPAPALPEALAAIYIPSLLAVW